MQAAVYSAPSVLRRMEVQWAKRQAAVSKSRSRHAEYLLQDLNGR